MKKIILVILLFLPVAAAIVMGISPKELEGEYVLTENGEHFLLHNLTWETDAFRLVNVSDDPNIFASLESGDRIRVTLSDIQSTSQELIAEIVKCQKIPAENE